MKKKSKNKELDANQNHLLNQIQNKVLWLAVYMVDYANKHKTSLSGLKVGGHQASSSSVATIMTYLFFEFMKNVDAISIKPHSSPVYHAIQYLLGNLDQSYLKTLRSFGGLQAYPSRTKDPDNVDFTTGSVGLGAVAPNFAWLASEYIHTRFDMAPETKGRFISLVGDAELDEGVVWEAIADQSLSSINRLIWIVDLNRQSLDRVIPGIRVNVWRQMFEANGWNVVEAKYGALLESAFSMDKGDLLRESIDNMPNQMYQRLLRSDGLVIRDWLPRFTKHENDLREFINQWDDAGLLELISNLGGHDFNTLRDRFATLDVEKGPNVVFAYTLKGWKLPTVGDPQNHSVLLNSNQMEEFRNSLNIENGKEFEGFTPKSKVGLFCAAVSERLNASKVLGEKDISYAVPKSFSKGYSGNMSTQQIFGLILTELTRSAQEVSDRIVTVSPDVASSTNLGGWINKVGVWSKQPSEELPIEHQLRALTWEESDKGQHLELGISENNLFICLGQLGLTNEREGELVLPIGTLYDPFIRRGLDALVYSLQSGGKFIFVGTPSGLTLSPEGGSHQSIITPSIGYELPELNYYEPCYGKELEWILLDSLDNIKNRKVSTYLRLTSKRIDQSFGDFQGSVESLEIRREQVIKGAYRIIDRSKQSGYSIGDNVVNILGCGAILPEAIKASEQLYQEGIYANVINITGPGPLYKDFQSSVSSKLTGKSTESYLKKLIPESSLGVPVVTVVDGHPHSLSWVGAALETKVLPLGVSEYGQSGTPEELYVEYGIDSVNIMNACFEILDL